MANPNKNQRWLYLSSTTNPPHSSSGFGNSAEGLEQVDEQGWLVLSPAGNSLQSSGVNQRWLYLSTTTNPPLNSNEGVDSLERLEDIDKAASPESRPQSNTQLEESFDPRCSSR